MARPTIAARDQDAAVLAQRQKISMRDWEAMRYGPLPPNVYRILDCSGDAGCLYQLELGKERITLSNRAGNAQALYGDTARAVFVARDHIAERFGEAAGAEAQFRFVWSGDIG
jgi:hypothetical protein